MEPVLDAGSHKLDACHSVRALQEEVAPQLIPLRGSALAKELNDTELAALSPKAQVNLLGARVIELLWQEVSDIRKAYPECDGLGTYAGIGQFTPAAPDLLDRIWGSRPDLARHALMLAQATEGCLTFASLKVFGGVGVPVSERVSSSDREKISDLAFRLSRHHPEGFGCMGEFTPEAFISGGVRTGATFMWETLRILPELFKAETGRPVTELELKELTESASGFVSVLAASHVSVLQALHDEVADGAVLERFRPEAFGLKRSRSGAWQLALKAESEDAIRGVIKAAQLPEYDAHWTRCPAALARAPSGRSVAFEMVGWVKSCAERFLFPRAAEIGLIL